MGRYEINVVKLNKNSSSNDRYEEPAGLMAFRLILFVIYTYVVGLLTATLIAEWQYSQQRNHRPLVMSLVCFIILVGTMGRRIWRDLNKKRVPYKETEMEK
jgi:hypothetical protein